MEPLAASESNVRYEEAPVHGEHEKKHVFGHTGGRAGRTGCDGDAAIRRGGDVGLVISDTLVLDQAEAPRRRDGIRRDRRRGDEDEVGVSDRLFNRLVAGSDAKIDGGRDPCPNDRLDLRGARARDTRAGRGSRVEAQELGGILAAHAIDLIGPKTERLQPPDVRRHAVGRLDVLGLAEVSGKDRWNPRRRAECGRRERAAASRHRRSSS